VDNANGRVLGNEFDSSNTTIKSYIAYCSTNNFTITEVEYADQCCDYVVCGESIGPAALFDFIFEVVVANGRLMSDGGSFH
jgi:hypothetical protein